jgi:hypothetical protein
MKIVSRSMLPVKGTIINHTLGPLIKKTSVPKSNVPKMQKD